MTDDQSDHLDIGAAIRQLEAKHHMTTREFLAQWNTAEGQRRLDSGPDGWDFNYWAALARLAALPDQPATIQVRLVQRGDMPPILSGKADLLEDAPPDSGVNDD